MYRLHNDKTNPQTTDRVTLLKSTLFFAKKNLISNKSCVWLKSKNRAMTSQKPINKKTRIKIMHISIGKSRQIKTSH